MGKIIHQKFKYVLYEMTANQLGNTKINTLLFRKAVMFWS
jgi:hypothetical protein